MTAPPAPDAVRPAPAELAALALAVRPGWDPAVVGGVIQGARDAAMPWPLVLAAFARLMADPLAGPRDLLRPRDSPLVRRPGTSPPAAWHQARQAIGRSGDGGAP
jgi:hypothetical protein